MGNGKRKHDTRETRGKDDTGRKRHLKLFPRSSRPRKLHVADALKYLPPWDVTPQKTDQSLRFE